MERNSLAKGKVCYIVMFDDPGLMVPVIQTLIYEDEVTREDRSHYHLFRELKPSGGTAKFSVEDEHVEELLLDQSELLVRLSTAFSGRLSKP
jgi:hypothetical protein